jgi:Activator of Hsp90 ATPase homolog 1-like protein
MPNRYESMDRVFQALADGRRITHTSTLSVEDIVVTVSLTTVELTPEGDTTRLTLTEHGAFLDGHEQPQWRAQGTSEWLDALDAELAHRGTTPT